MLKRPHACCNHNFAIDHSVLQIFEYQMYERFKFSSLFSMSHVSCRSARGLAGMGSLQGPTANSKVSTPSQGLRRPPCDHHEYPVDWTNEEGQPRVGETFYLNQLKSTPSQLLPVFPGLNRLQTCCHSFKPANIL